MGDVLTTEENQSLWNKSLGNELDANLQRISNLNLPKENGDAVNKKYVDSRIDKLIDAYFIRQVSIDTTKQIIKG